MMNKFIEEIQEIIPMETLQVEPEIPKPIEPRKRERPKGTNVFTPEERRKRACEAAKKCYYNNYEYRSLQKKLYYRRRKDERTINSLD